MGYAFMNATAPIFRFRVWLIVLLYLSGFLAPWQWLLHSSTSTLWLTASTLLARTGWLDLAAATLTVTNVAFGCLVAGALLRVWGAAYLGHFLVRDSSMHGNRLIASGPYRYLRHPLYLGLWLQGLGISILMPLSGALFFLAAFSALLVLLAITEMRFLAGRASDETEGRPQWGQALVGEVLPIAFTACFAAFAWRYNAHILIKCLLVCYGVSLVLQALLPSAATRAAIPS